MWLLLLILKTFVRVLSSIYIFNDHTRLIFLGGILKYDEYKVYTNPVSNLYLFTGAIKPAPHA